MHEKRHICNMHSLLRRLTVFQSNEQPLAFESTVLRKPTVSDSVLRFCSHMIDQRKQLHFVDYYVGIREIRISWCDILVCVELQCLQFMKHRQISNIAKIKIRRFRFGLTVRSTNYISTHTWKNQENLYVLISQSSCCRVTAFQSSRGLCFP